MSTQNPKIILRELDREKTGVNLFLQELQDRFRGSFGEFILGRVAAGVVDFHLGVRQVLVVGFADGQSYNTVLPSPQYQRFFGKRGDPAVE